MKHKDIVAQKEVELGGKKFLAYLRICKHSRTGNLFVCPKITPIKRRYSPERDIFEDYPKLKDADLRGNKL